MSAAGLDVYEQEPPSSDNPLITLKNVVLSPHVAGEDSLSSRMMGIEAASNVIRLHQGEWPEGAVVNDELQDEWQWELEG